MYVWVDGIHFNIRLEDERLCTLVMLGVRPDGTKELMAVEDGYRESTGSWAVLLRDDAAPVLAVGDGALGFWAAVRKVWPEKEQRDWCHKIANVLDKLPKGLQAKAKRALREIMYAETREDADERIDRFAAMYGPKHPKAAACLVDDREALLTFFDFPGCTSERRILWCRHSSRCGCASGSRRAPAPDEGPDDGVQAARDGRAALASTERRPPVAAGPRRRALR